MKRYLVVTGAIAALLATVLFPWVNIVPARWSLAGPRANVPPPAREVVGDKDIAGTWYYRGAAPGTICEITFNTNGTYSLVHRHSKLASTNAGCWQLASPDLYLTPFWMATRRGPVERQRLVCWWLTGPPNDLVAPFGGDSLNPRRWALLSRATVEPALGGPAGGWYGLVAGLAVVLCVGVALHRGINKALVPRPIWSSGSSLGSAVVPQIRRLRDEALSHGPVPAHHAFAHRWLVATARRFVAQLAYFRKLENSDPAVPHQTRDHTE